MNEIGTGTTTDGTSGLRTCPGCTNLCTTIIDGLCPSCLAVKNGAASVVVDVTNDPAYTAMIQQNTQIIEQNDQIIRLMKTAERNRAKMGDELGRIRNAVGQINGRRF